MDTLGTVKDGAMELKRLCDQASENKERNKALSEVLDSLGNNLATLAANHANDCAFMAESVALDYLRDKLAKGVAFTKEFQAGNKVWRLMNADSHGKKIEQLRRDIDSQTAQLDIELGNERGDQEKARQVLDKVCKGARAELRGYFAQYVVTENVARFIGSGLGSRKAITEVDLRDNSSEIAYVVANWVFVGAPHVNVLADNRVLVDAVRDMDKAQRKALAKAVDAMKDGDTFLGLYGYGFGPGGAVMLAPRIARLSNLKTLHLEGNNVGDTGAVALAASLPGLTRLSQLWLSSNNVGDSGAVALAASLPGLTMLSKLYLGSNNVGDNGAVALAASLPGLTRLSVLSLHSNQLSEAGKRAIRQALPASCKNCSLW